MFGKRVMVVHGTTELLELSLYTRKQSVWSCVQQHVFTGPLAHHTAEILLFLKKAGTAKTIMTLPYHFIFQRKLTLPAALSRSQLLKYIAHKKTEWFPMLTAAAHVHIEKISPHEKIITLTPKHQLDPLLSLLEKTRLTICVVTIREYLIQAILTQHNTKKHSAYLYQSVEGALIFVVFNTHEIVWHDVWIQAELPEKLQQFFKDDNSLSIDTLFLVNHSVTLHLETVKIVPVKLDLSLLAVRRVQHEI